MTLELLEGSPSQRAPVEQRDAASERLQDPREAIICAGCGHEITDPSASTEVDGKHRHTFVNPHGFVFSIRCFVRAPGCSQQGPASTYWSWFAGCSWQTVYCARCDAHLGWLFRGRSRFFGLIADKLHEVGGPAPG